MRNMSQNLELIMHRKVGPNGQKVIPRYLLRILSRNEVGFIFLSISQLFRRNFYGELLNIGFLVILFLISIKFT
jgi:hypothetical protein